MFIVFVAPRSTMIARSAACQRTRCLHALGGPSVVDGSTTLILPEMRDRSHQILGAGKRVGFVVSGAFGFRPPRFRSHGFPVSSASIRGLRGQFSSSSVDQMGTVAGPFVGPAGEKRSVYPVFEIYRD